MTERLITVEQLVDWISRPGAEVALVRTAAVFAPERTVVVDGRRHTVGTAGINRVVERLRHMLITVQTEDAPFVFDDAS